MQVRNPDSDAETEFKSGKRNFDLVFGHPDRMHRRSDFLENRSGHFGQNVQHRSCCGILCWCADLHDLYAVWDTDRRCFLPASQCVVSGRKWIADGFGSVYSGWKGYIFCDTAGFVRLHHFWS